MRQAAASLLALEQIVRKVWGENAATLHLCRRSARLGLSCIALQAAASVSARSLSFFTRRQQVAHTRCLDRKQNHNMGKERFTINPFPALELSDAVKNQLLELGRTIIEANFERDDAFFKTGRKVDHRRWKLAKERERIAADIASYQIMENGRKSGLIRSVTSHSSSSSDLTMMSM
ncbi:hypothetical protein PF006_g2392 [Phytophthora fragariae]|uniref:Uncharacterized protein n=1 Tax=Phytophthora fragariae TaxID=53985 RepID=A0A6A3UQG8_9STRA|nr:hypothetical protein PF006_g2392 [Phytophthora fragariae]